jgi:hypothetical protein
MLDDLRNSIALEENQQPVRQKEGKDESKPFLGMTAPQRFVIALMMLLMVCVMGTLFLLVTEKMVLF